MSRQKYRHLSGFRVLPPHISYLQTVDSECSVRRKTNFLIKTKILIGVDPLSRYFIKNKQKSEKKSKFFSGKKSKQTKRYVRKWRFEFASSFHSWCSSSGEQENLLNSDDINRRRQVHSSSVLVRASRKENEKCIVVLLTKLLRIPFLWEVL